MLEYFGFYASNPEPDAPELDEPERERVVARAARLADRSRHTPTAGPTGPTWEPGGKRER